MKDNEIFELIKSSADDNAPTLDFEDVKKRIAARQQADDTEKITDISSAAKKQAGIKRLSAAAACIAVLLMGVLFLRVAMLGAVKSEPSDLDMSSSFETAAEDSFEYADNAEDAFSSEAPMMSDDSYGIDASFDGINTETNGVPNSAEYVEDEEEPQTHVSPADAAVAPTQSEPLEEHYIKELEMKIGVPSYSYSTGSKVPENYPPLEIMGITADELEANYRRLGICFNAVWFDDGADVVEIVVSHEDLSDNINSLSSLSEYELEQLRQSFIMYGVDSPDSPRYYDVSLVMLDGQPYIRALGQDRSGRSCQAQYMTIINGQRIKLSLIEHYTDAETMPELGVSSTHAALLDNVASSVKYDRIRGEFAYKLSRIRPNIWVAIIGILALLAYGIYYIIENRKRIDAEGDEKYDDIIKECSESAETDSSPSSADDDTNIENSDDTEPSDDENANGDEAKNDNVMENNCDADCENVHEKDEASK